MNSVFIYVSTEATYWIWLPDFSHTVWPQYWWALLVVLVSRLYALRQQGPCLLSILHKAWHWMQTMFVLRKCYLMMSMTVVFASICVALSIGQVKQCDVWWQASCTIPCFFQHEAKQKAGPTSNPQWSRDLGGRTQNARFSLDCNLGGSRTPNTYWTITVQFLQFSWPVFEYLPAGELSAMVDSPVFELQVLSVLRSKWTGGKCPFPRPWLDVLVQMEQSFSHTAGAGQVSQ